MKKQVFVRVMAFILSMLTMMSAVPVTSFASETTTVEDTIVDVPGTGSEPEVVYDHPWYVWDFEKGSATNTSGSSKDNTLSLVKTGVSGAESVSDLLQNGALAATKNTTMKLSTPVTLNSADGWMIEIVVKGVGGTIRSFMSTAATLSGTYIYIADNGDLCMVKKGSFTADDGTAVESYYTYYKVSNEDFNNSVLASGDFDPNEYHTYQLRCVDGAFYFWLDGAKIGKLAMSEQSGARSAEEPDYTKGTGTPFNFSTLKMTHIGCGSSKNAASQGLMGEVKRIAIYGGCHIFERKTATSEYLKSPKDCNNAAQYYTSCMICHASSKGTEYESAFAYGSASHEYETDERLSPSCVNHGYRVTTCSDCQHSYEEYLQAFSGYTWDFSKGSATSTNGLNTLTFVRTSGKDTGVVLKDGVLASDRNIYKMSQSVKLSTSEDWTMEAVISGVEGTAIRGVFSTGAAYGSAIFTYINSAGDLFLGKKVGFTADDGTSVASGYTYYKVSDEDFAANMPEDFDITEANRYELRCTSGVLSYWLNGEKIGDLSMSEQATGRGTDAKHYTKGNGAPFDFSTMTMSYIGCGATSNANYGLTGSVSYLGIYPGHSYTNACDAYCDNTGCTHVREAGHTWDDGVITLEPNASREGIRTYTCRVCGGIREEVIPKTNGIHMYYDDRLDVSSLGVSGEPVITDQIITSKKVGTDTFDDALVTYVNGKLIAVGVGSAILTWGSGDDAMSFVITVESAPISLIMITGHSLGSGSQGDKTQNIICEDGQVYCTNERAYSHKITIGNQSAGTVVSKDVTGMGLGYGSELRPSGIDTLIAAGAGVNGMDSGFAYRWTQLTGEKIWILNSAKGSTQLQTWQEGGYNYKHAVALFQTAEEILYNEYLAGHYTMSHMGIVNYTTANGDQTWEPEKYTKAFNSMWDGFREEMARYDFNGDGEKDTVDCIGLLTFWGVCSMNKWDNMHKEPLAFYNGSGTPYYGKLINYAMSYFENNGVIMASDVGRSWTSDADVEEYFKKNPIENLYGVLQNGKTHTSPTTMRDGVYGDGVHYNQLGYNVQGIESAESMYEYWYGKNETTSFKLVQADGVSLVPDQITIPLGESYAIVPMALPSSTKLTYELTGDAISYSECTVWTKKQGNATLTIKTLDGEIVKTVEITVGEPLPPDYDSFEWYQWDFSNGSATNTAGSSTDLTLTFVKSGVASTMEGLLTDGVLNASKATTLKLSKGIKLDAENNWNVKLVAKGDGTNSIKSFLSTGVQIGSATYFYISHTGDLCIVKKGSMTADDGTSVSSTYLYYKVSNEDYANSILATDDFDVTEYHTYQVCCADGVLSYWLDGTKIGDFALTEASTGRNDTAKEYTKGIGTPFDFSTMTVTHIGCGSSSNSTSQALTATVKELSIYASSGKLSFSVGLDAIAGMSAVSANPGDKIVLSKPDNGNYCAKFIGWSENNDGSGTLYKAGDVYEVKSFAPVTLYGVWEAFESSDGIHVYQQGVCTNCGSIDERYYPWYRWDFEDGTAVSGNISNSITLITTNHNGATATGNGTMSVANGIMSASGVAMELEKAIKLEASKGWCFEITMSIPNGATPKMLLGENKLFSQGNNIYMTANGNLMLVKKGTISGTNDYWYLMVSEEDFKANMPANYDPTQYHTYQLRCTNGVLSYWLDGAKIGDLTLSCNSGSYSASIKHEGKHLNYDVINAKYIGNGNTGNVKAFGFTGNVESMAIYTDSDTLVFDMQLEQAEKIDSVQANPNSIIILPTPETGDFCAKFLGWTENADGTGKVYAAGEAYVFGDVREMTLYAQWAISEGDHSHNYDSGTVTPPTCCKEGYTTYTCQFCGSTNVDNVTAKIPHTFEASVAEKKYLHTPANYDKAAVYYKSCTECGISSVGFLAESTFEHGVPGDGYYNVITKNEWDIAPGIVESEIILNNGSGDRRQVMHVMEVDINNPYASILPSYMGMNPTLGNYQTGTMSQQAAWVEQNLGLNVVGAMNTCLSWYDSEYYQQNPHLKGEPLGILIIDGTVYSNNTISDTCLVVNFDEKDGVARPADMPKVEMRSTSDGITGWEEQVISCNFGFIVKNGKNTASVSHENQGSKSILGIKADGTIVIMQNDGRQAPYSGGMSVYEVAEAMIALGCVYAVRGDGGGSSAYLSQRPGEELKVNCSPSDGIERPTTSGILVISTAPSTGEFVRANISSDNYYYAPGSEIKFSVIGTDLAGTKAEIPENVIWQIKESGMGTVENGVFVSNGTVGTVTVQMVYNGNVVGEHTVEIVVPEEIKFQQSVITIPFGKTVELVLIGTVNGGINTVVLNPKALHFETTNTELGTYNGFFFTAKSEENAPENLKSTVTVTIEGVEGVTATAQLNLGKASVVIADFEDGKGNWYMNNWNGICDYELKEVDAESGYVHSGNGAVAMIMKNENHMSSAGSYAQFGLCPGLGFYINNATSIGAWVYIPDDFYNLWLEFNYYTQDANGSYSVANQITVLAGGDVYKVLEDSGWYYLSVDVSDYESVCIKGAFIEILSQHCSTNALFQETGSPHGQSTIYVDDIIVDYSAAADDREAPIFGQVTLNSGEEEYPLAKREMPTISNNIVTIKTSVSEDMSKQNATGLNASTAKAYIDGVEVDVEYSNGQFVLNNIALANGAHRVKFEICDNMGNKSVVIRVFNVESDDTGSTIQVVPKDPTLDRLLGGSVYWVDLNATMIETIQQITFDIDLNATNHWELDHMVLAAGFTASYVIDEKTNTATITITRTGKNNQTGMQTIASLPIRVVYFDTDIALDGYTAETFWKEYNFWPQDVKIDVDRGVIVFVPEYESNTLASFSSPEYAIDTEMYTNGQAMDPDYRAEKGTAHVHTITVLADKNATCTEAGYMNRTYCAVCNSVVDWGTIVDAVEHSYEFIDGKLTCVAGGELFNGVYTDGKTYIDGVIGEDGWNGDSYFLDGKKLIGVHIIEGKYYEFDKNGICAGRIPLSLWYTNEKGESFYLSAGVPTTKYAMINSVPTFFDDNGVAYHGEVVINGELCVFNKGEFVECRTNVVLLAGRIGDKADFIIYDDGTFVLCGEGATWDLLNVGQNALPDLSWKNRPWGNQYNDYSKSIKKVIIGKEITSIGDYLFNGVHNLAVLEFEEGSKLEYIGSQAFNYAQSLISVILPETVKSLEYGTFGYCLKMKSLYIPFGCTTISHGAFVGVTPSDLILQVEEKSKAYDYAIKYGFVVEVREKTPEIIASGTCGENVRWTLDEDGKLSILGSGAMSDYTATTGPWVEYRSLIKSIFISKDITSIGKYAFAWCQNVSEVIFEEGSKLETIDNNAFHYIRKLTRVVLPEAVKTIGFAAFGYGAILEYVYIPSTVTFIHTDAFINPNAALVLAVEEGSYAHQYAINKGYNVEVRVDLPDVLYSGTCGENVRWTLDEDGRLSILGSGAMSDYTATTGPWVEYRLLIKSIFISKDITSIGKYAFAWCQNVSEVIFEEGSKLETIDNNAFHYIRKLTEVVLPETVKTIGFAAFGYGAILEYVYIPSTVTFIHTDAFINPNASLTLVVEQGSYAHEFAVAKNIGVKLK